MTSGVKISAANARPLATPRPSTVGGSSTSSSSNTKEEPLPKAGGAKGEAPHKSGVAPSELGRGASPRPSSRKVPPERPELSASDVEWWAESALTNTFEQSSTFDQSRVIAIEDPNDPNYGDRVTPVFLESITPVFPESKVREVMALADAVERRRSPVPRQPPADGSLPSNRGNLAPTPPPVPAKAPALPPMAHLAMTPPAPPVAEMVEASVWNVPSVDTAPLSARPLPARPHVPLPAPPQALARAKSAAPKAYLPTAVPEAGALHFGRAPRPLAQPPLPDPDASDQLRAVTFASAGADVSMMIWIAMVLVVILVAATMVTVG